MFPQNENHFWKTNSPNLPGCLKQYEKGDIKNNNFRKKNNSISHPPSKIIPLSPDLIRDTAFQIIKNHNALHGDKDLNVFGNSSSQISLSKLSLEDNIPPQYGNEEEKIKKTPSEPQFSSSSTPNTPSINCNPLTPQTPHTPSTPTLPFPGRSIRSKKSLNNLGSGLEKEPEEGREMKIFHYISSVNIQLDELRKLCWSGIPYSCRSQTWKLLSCYIPVQENKRNTVLERKRMEYMTLKQRYFDQSHIEKNKEIYHQIHIDIPRMSPLLPIFQQQLVQKIFERILFIWAIRHPASGYVQGMNDLVTPFFVVFLSPFVDNRETLQTLQVSKLPGNVLEKVEADSFWCFSRLLDGIQNNYTFAQPGIQKWVNVLKDLMTRINNPLHLHLVSNNVEYLQFSFRWMNNLLTREFTLPCTIRLWDTYLSEPDGFSSFHLYVCAALLHKFSEELLNEKDFHGIMMFLKQLPTENWNEKDIQLLLADAYRLKFAFADAPKHFD